MPNPSHREEELEHAGAVCGWFSAEWAPESYRGRRRRVETSVLDLVTLIDEPSHNIFEALSDYLFVGARTRWAEGAGAQASRFRAVQPKPRGNADEAVSAFASSVSGIEGVEGVLFVEAADNVRVWTIMDEPDRDTEDRVYAAEAAALDGNPDLLFDFRIIFRHAKPIEDIRPAEAKDAR